MKLNDHFKSMLGDISLNPSREDRINSAFDKWQTLLQEDEEIVNLFDEFFLQGSYGTNTAIRPLNSNEFDVDAVLLLSLDESLLSSDALKWLADRMKLNQTYKDKIKVKDRCVRINYSGDFHMDIVLAKPSDTDFILIPSKKDGEWCKTNPMGFVEWCTEVQKNNQKQFSNITKLLKYWRDLKVGKETAPKSILWTTLIGKYMVGKSSIAESLVETLKNITTNIESIILSDDTVFVENPSLSEENLARDWTKEDYNIFKKKLDKLKGQAVDAFDEENKDSSINKWREIFGTKFPTELSEAQNMAEAVSAGQVFVTPQGVLNQEQSGIQIPKHRFFGGSYN